MSTLYDPMLVRSSLDKYYAKTLLGFSEECVRLHDNYTDKLLNDVFVDMPESLRKEVSQIRAKLSKKLLQNTRNIVALEKLLNISTPFVKSNYYKAMMRLMPTIQKARAEKSISNEDLSTFLQILKKNCIDYNRTKELFSLYLDCLDVIKYVRKEDRPSLQQLIIKCLMLVYKKEFIDPDFSFIQSIRKDLEKRVLRFNRTSPRTTFARKAELVEKKCMKVIDQRAKDGAQRRKEKKAQYAPFLSKYPRDVQKVFLEKVPSKFDPSLFKSFENFIYECKKRNYSEEEFHFLMKLGLLALLQISEKNRVLSPFKAFLQLPKEAVEVLFRERADLENCQGFFRDSCVFLLFGVPSETCREITIDSETPLSSAVIEYLKYLPLEQVRKKWKNLDYLFQINKSVFGSVERLRQALEDEKILSYYKQWKPIWEEPRQVKTIVDELGITPTNVRAVLQELRQKIQHLEEAIFLHKPVDMQVYQSLWHYLTPEQQYEIAKNNPNETHLSFFYAAEHEGHFAEYLANRPLSEAPVEPLVRYLMTMPLQESIEWLQESIGDCTRLETLSSVQKETILRRFSRKNSTLPLPEWMQLFEISEQQAQSICQIEPRPLTVQEERWHERLQEVVDQYDPRTLYKQVLEEVNKRNYAYLHDHGIELAIFDLLLKAKEVSACGAQSYLTWANAFEGSLCSTQDGAVLFARLDNKRISLAQQGVFNSFDQLASPISLRIRMLALTAEQQRMLKLLLKGHILPRIPENEVVELVLEIQRLAHNFSLMHPAEQMLDSCSDSDVTDGRNSSGSDLSSDSSNSSLSSSESDSSSDSSSSSLSSSESDSSSDSSRNFSEEGEDEQTLERNEIHSVDSATIAVEDSSSLAESASDVPEIDSGYDGDNERAHKKEGFLVFRQSKYPKPFFKSLQKAYTFVRNMPKVKAVYDSNEMTHRMALSFISLLLVLRESKLKLENQMLKIRVNNTSYGEYTIPFIHPDKYVEYADDNPHIHDFYGSLSQFPLHQLSPFTPNRKISPLRLFHFWKMVTELEDVDFEKVCGQCLNLMCEDEISVQEFFARFSEACSGIVHVQEFEDILVTLTKNYIAMLDGQTPLLPNKTYFFNSQNINQFGNGDEIPEFLRSQGNFAGAIVQSFTPHEPTSHDGNCGVHSFLLGMYGVDSLAEKTELRREIGTFRSKIVEYAQQHKEELIEKFGETDVNRLIDRFARDQYEYATSIVWYIASEIYQRPIYIYSLTDGTFSTDEETRVCPVAGFGEQYDNFPISLMYWDNVHYCLLLSNQG